MMLRSLGVCAALLAAVACAEEPEAEDDGEGGRGGEGGAPEVVMAPEAGFVDVPGTRDRMFYAFRPADEHPEDAPVLVYFNGGPGTATTSVLLPYGTGPMTLDPVGDVADVPAPNPTSHTRFANLLYIDARGTGFSYAVAGPGHECADEPATGDAADFAWVLLEVLDAHEPLVDNPVVLVGESYGGTRAALMLYMLQRYAEAGEAPPIAPDIHGMAPWLVDRMRGHLARAFPETEGRDLTANEVAAQFGYQILIQPSIFGPDQAEFQQQYLEADPDFEEHFASPGDFDVYDVRRSIEDGERVSARAAAAMRTPAYLDALLGVAVTSIPRLSAAERAPAERDLSLYDRYEVRDAEAAMHEQLGALDDGDAYWLPRVLPCGQFAGDGKSLHAFGDILPRTQTFITNARYDGVVYTEALPIFFSTATGTEVTLDPTAPAGAARPGEIRLAGETLQATIRFPTYEAGHAVTVGAPAAFAEDVEAWLIAVGATR